MSVIRVCFLGTPDFAAKHLQHLLNDDHYEVVGVVTQPDRPAGRKMQLTPSPVKTLALAHKLSIITSENLRKDSESLATIKSWRAEVAVVVAYGQILSQEFLDSFDFGAVNVHGSLLPKWRGAAPIQRSIEAGDAVTGVALQKIVKKLDAGAVIGERRVNLNDEVTATELYEKLALLGCDLLHIELMDYLRGNLAALEQDETQVTIAKKIEKEESLIDWNSSAKNIHNKVRAFTMGPGTYILWQSKRLKIHSTQVLDPAVKGAVGVIQNLTADSLVIQTGEGLLSILEVQPESKPRMPIVDFLKSVSLKKGDLFV
jgi:methionyl-tRNA formyltransferase